jgi:hypothetical protein
MTSRDPDQAYYPIQSLLIWAVTQYPGLKLVTHKSARVCGPFTSTSDHAA